MSDWEWHSLEVVVEPSSASLFVDGRRFHRRAYFSDANLLNLATNFYVGAVPDEAMLPRDGGTGVGGGFRGGSRRAVIGCVDRVRIRGRPESWRTVISSSEHTRTKCVDDLFFGCNQTLPCPVTTGVQKPHSIANPHGGSSSITVLEGGRAALNVDHIGSIAVGTLPQLDIRFRASANQLHGRLASIAGDREPAVETDDREEIEFSFSDIAQGQIWYVHDGSETTSDSVRLSVIGNQLIRKKLIS